ncbi:hypothetical protein EJB05_36222, partial [Eragrostis curvula]
MQVNNKRMIHIYARHARLVQLMDLKLPLCLHNGLMQLTAVRLGTCAIVGPLVWRASASGRETTCRTMGALQSVISSLSREGWHACCPSNKGGTSHLGEEEVVWHSGTEATSQVYHRRRAQRVKQTACRTLLLYVLRSTDSHAIRVTSAS